MSANARLLWTIPVLFVASWLAVRAVAASPPRTPTSQADIGDPPVPFAVASREISDPALARFIGGLAAGARN